jgi:hypothetical protein
MNKSTIEGKIIELLQEAIGQHYIGNFESCRKIGELSETIAEILETEKCPNRTFSIARNFTDGWGDSCNHEWKYYKGIQQSDWPRHAKTIIECIENTKEITEPVVIEHFGPRKPGNSFLHMLLKLLNV